MGLALPKLFTGESFATTAEARLVVATKYDALLPVIRETAKDHGYAIGLHGSMVRDLDLIAVPWATTVSHADVLAEAIREVLNGVIINDSHADLYDETKRNPVNRPHGRQVWAIQIGGGRYVDLSVMPIQELPS
jgi:hypothetical protein